MIASLMISETAVPMPVEMVVLVVAVVLFFHVLCVDMTD